MAITLSDAGDFFKTITPLGITVCVVVIVLIFHKPLWELIMAAAGALNRLRRVKAAGTELELAQSEESPQQVQAEADSGSEDIGGLPEPPELSSPVKPEDSKGPYQRMFAAFSSHDIEKGEEAYQQLQEAETDQPKKLQNEIWYFTLRYMFAEDSSALPKLKELAAKTQAPLAYRNIGFCYHRANEFPRAAQAFEMAAERADTPRDRVERMAWAAESLLASGDFEAALQTLGHELTRPDSEPLSFEIYSAIAGLCKTSKHSLLEAIAGAKALQDRPNHIDLLTQAGYAYSQGEHNQSLAILHYEKLLGFSPDAGTAANNTGVAYGNLNLPIHAVESYHKAVNGGSTLGAANLAYQLMDAGFASEADKVLEDARGKEEVHPNVGSAIGQLAETREEEGEKREKLLAAARTKQDFLHRFAEALFVPADNPPTVTGPWSTDSPVLVHIEAPQEGRLVGQWISEGQEYELRGTLRNNASICSYVPIGKNAAFHQYSRGTAFVYFSPSTQGLSMLIASEEEQAFTIYEFSRSQELDQD